MLFLTLTTQSLFLFSLGNESFFKILMQINIDFIDRKLQQIKSYAWDVKWQQINEQNRHNELYMVLSFINSEHVVQFSGLLSMIETCASDWNRITKGHKESLLNNAQGRVYL